MRHLTKGFQYVVWVLVAISAAILVYVSSVTAAEDAQEQSQRIIAIGDLHGDYGAYSDILYTAGLTNERGRWTGGNSILVQLGDVTDRGPDSLKIIKHLRKLKKQAARKGGQVIVLVGNHEAMNMTNDLRYVHEGEYEAFRDNNSERRRELTYSANKTVIEQFYKSSSPGLTTDEIKKKWFENTPLGKLEHQSAWKPNGELGEWTLGNPAIVVLERVLFVHGGLSEKYGNYSINELNGAVRTGLQTQNQEPTNIINDPYGPLWYRGLLPQHAENGEQTPELELKRVLNAHSIERIVVGHTPSLGGIASHFGGRLIQIDTGISAYYGGTRSYLEIVDGIVYANDNGRRSIIELSVKLGGD